MFMLKLNFKSASNKEKNPFTVSQDRLKVLVLQCPLSILYMNGGFADRALKYVYSLIRPVFHWQFVDTLFNYFLSKKGWRKNNLQRVCWTIKEYTFVTWNAYLTFNMCSHYLTNPSNPTQTQQTILNDPTPKRLELIVETLKDYLCDQ